MLETLALLLAVIRASSGMVRFSLWESGAVLPTDTLTFLVLGLCRGCVGQSSPPTAQFPLGIVCARIPIGWALSRKMLSVSTGELSKGKAQTLACS